MEVTPRFLRLFLRGRKVSPDSLVLVSFRYVIINRFGGSTYDGEIVIGDNLLSPGVAVGKVSRSTGTRWGKVNSVFLQWRFEPGNCYSWGT
jgi:hypothetical protein